MLALALAALAGCSVEGRVNVQSATAVEVDVTVRADRSPYCNADIVGLSTIPERGRGGVITSCRYLGTMDPSQLGWALGLATAGEYLVAVFNPLQVPASGSGDSTENQLDAVDVTIVLPGSVQEANSGQVTGDRVRITDPAVMTLPGGLRLVALNHAGPAHWVWWFGGGILLGVLGATGVLIVVRRRIGRAPVPPPVDQPGEAEPEPSPVTADPAPSTGDPASRPTEPDGDADWSRPIDRTPPQIAVPNDAPPDTSIWAPDERT